MFSYNEKGNWKRIINCCSFFFSTLGNKKTNEKKNSFSIYLQYKIVNNRRKCFLIDLMFFGVGNKIMIIEVQVKKFGLLQSETDSLEFRWLSYLQRDDKE